MTSPAPQISVIMATWGRGRHILPSIRSVLAQDMPAFELLVVGDACADETEATVAAIPDSRLRWLNLPTRVGSQAGPNNAGIKAARADIVAYLGHDDIWAPWHLRSVLEGFARLEHPDFVISGLITHFPAGAKRYMLGGLFADDSDKHHLFFPPSSVAHRKDVCERIGFWNMPFEITLPVDRDFQSRAVDADLRYLSTGQVTVHKISAAARYLSYLRHDSHEQEAMLAEVAAPGHAERVAEQAKTAQDRNWVALRSDQVTSGLAKGQFARSSLARRGVTQLSASPMGQARTVRHGVEDSAYDWMRKPFLGIRRHKVNYAPRLLLPFTADGPVTLRFRAYHRDRSALARLVFDCNDSRIVAKPSRLRIGVYGWTALYQADIRLQKDRASVLEFHLSPKQRRKWKLGPFRLGFGVGALHLRQQTAS